MGYGPLIKYGLIVVAFLAFCAGLIYYGETRKQMEWDASIAEQQMATGTFIVAQAYNSARSDRAHQQQVQQQQRQVRTLTKKVRDYETQANTKCELSPEFEHVFDSISRMREPAANGVSAAADPAGVHHDADPANLTDAAILPAYQSAVTQLYQCTDQLETLIEWVRSSTTIAAHGAGR